MNDMTVSSPDDHALFTIAAGQMGYFTTSQARTVGFGPSLLGHHVKTAKFRRVYRGVYRLRDYPTEPGEEAMAAWLRVGADHGVVSHESALDLYDISDVIPNSIHITVPRQYRKTPDLPGVTVHTTTRPFMPLDIVRRNGMAVTSPTRTILDIAETGAAPDVVNRAIENAIERGLTTRKRLGGASGRRSRRVQRLIETGLRTTS